MADYSKFYTPIETNWYKQAPYTFVFTDSKGIKDSEYFNLPISPSNISIVTHFATNVVATMYGTIEEHSEQRYFDITISGTTGIGPANYEAVKKGILTKVKEKGDPITRNGRAGWNVATGVLGDNPLARRTKDLVNKALDQANDIRADVNDPITSGIKDNQTGYMAFHNFYRFLLDYKKKVSDGNISSTHPLKFINFKDNNAYDVSISNFQLTRDQRSPMLYNYSISMRAYNLTNADLATTVTVIGLAELGLGVATPTFAKMSNLARKAKNAAYSLIAAAKGFGK